MRVTGAAGPGGVSAAAAAARREARTGGPAFRTRRGKATRTREPDQPGALLARTTSVVGTDSAAGAPPSIAATSDATARAPRASKS